MAKVFAVRDLKAAAFIEFFISTSNAAAMRGFTKVANDPNSELSRFPTDFALFAVCEVDDVSGESKPCLAQLCTALEVKERPVSQLPLPIEGNAQKVSE